MKSVLLLTLLGIISVVTAVEINCLPPSIAGSSFYYAGYDDKVYKYSLPDLNLVLTKQYNQLFCLLASFSGSNIIMGANRDNTNSTLLSTNDLSIVSQINKGAPVPSFVYTGSNCNGRGEDVYCVVNEDGSSVVQRKNLDGNILETFKLPTSDTNSYYVSFDEDIVSRLHVTTTSCELRGCTSYKYYGLSLNPMAIVYGPVVLDNTLSAGCPVEPSGCAVPVLLKLNSRNDIISYMWSIAQDNQFKLTVVSYDPKCNISRSVSLGDSLPASSRCEAATGTPSTSTTSPSSTTAAPSTAAPSSTTAAPSTTIAPTSGSCSGSNVSGPNVASPGKRQNAVCSGNGYCNGSSCKCVAGYEGAECQTRTPSKTCAADVSGPNVASPGKRQSLCNGQGVCKNGACTCNAGWIGADCEQPVSPSCVPGENVSGPNVASPARILRDFARQAQVCSGNGYCLQQVCVCNAGFNGLDCNSATTASPSGENISGNNNARASAASQTMMTIFSTAGIAMAIIIALF